MRNEFLRLPAMAGVFQTGRGASAVAACALLALVAPASIACVKKPVEAPAPAAAAAAPELPADAVGAPMDCGEIAAARYPFLTCVRGESGRPVFASAGASASASEAQQAGQLEIPSKFVRGKGYWGPSGLE